MKTLLSKNKMRLAKKMYAKGKSIVEIADYLGARPKTVDLVIHPKDKNKKDKYDRDEYSCTSSLCKTCRYRGYMGWGEVHCAYILSTGMMRGCPVKNCAKYEKGEPPKIRTALPGGNYRYALYR